jgi:biopolymer transport protein ExbD
MASKIKGDDDVVAEINVTPFIDVVLVLLVALMITSTAIVHAAIKVELPKAASAKDTVSASINVTVTADGTCLVDGAPSSETELAGAFERERATHSEVVAVVAADKRVPYEGVARVIDIAKLHGATGIALNLAPSPQ